MSPKRFVLFLTLALVMTACSKQKTQIINGTILLCRKFPQPIANKPVEVYQSSVSGAIFSSGDASLAVGSTDITGHFSIRFNPAKWITCLARAPTKIR